MADTEAGLLPGERLLWTGRPARARVIPGDLIFPGLLLALLLAALALSAPRGPADGLGLGDEVVTGAAALAGVIATAVRALRVKPDELRRTVYQVTDRRVLTTTGTRHAWAAYLDQLAEPVVVPQRDGTADLMLRAKENFSLSTLADGQPLPRAFTPGIQPPFPVLRGLPDAEVARQVISTGRQRMLQGALDVPPVAAHPGSAEHTGFVPAPGERILWVGCPQAAPWWFGTADITFSAYFALFVVAIGFVLPWARSTGAPLVPITVFTAVAALAFGYPAIGRVLRRHARIKRSAYILTDSRLLTTWRDWQPAGRYAVRAGSDASAGGQGRFCPHVPRLAASRRPPVLPGPAHVACRQYRSAAAHRAIRPAGHRGSHLLRTARRARAHLAAKQHTQPRK